MTHYYKIKLSKRVLNIFLISCLWILIFWPALSYCQSKIAEIKGVVLNNSSQPLSFSTVKILNKGELLAITSCDSLGRFSLKFVRSVDSSTFVIANFLNHTSKPKQVNYTDQLIVIMIDTSIDSLNEVKITSTETQFTRRGDRYIFVPGSSLTKGSNILDIMRHAPLINYDEKSGGFSIINKANTVVYINNVKSQIPMQMLQQMLLSLPASDIKSIEIVTNPGSEYSANSQGGVININLKRQPYEGWLGSLTLQSQQSKYNTTILNGSISYRKNKLAIQLIPFFNRSYNYNTENDMLSYTNGINQANAIDHFRRYFVYGGGVNLDYDISSTSSLSFKYWLTDVNGNTHNTELSTFSKSVPRLPDSTISSPYHGIDFYTYNFGNINYHHSLGKDKDSYIDVNIDYNHFFQQREITGSFDGLDTNTGGITSENSYYNYLPQTFDNLSESFDFVTPFKNGLRLLAGLQYSNTQVSSDLKYYSVENGLSILDDSLSKNYYYKENYGAAYLSLKKGFSKKIYASVGLRLENTSYSTLIRNTTIRSDSTYWNLFPSGSLSYTINENNEVSYSLSRKIVRPNIESLFPGRIYNASNDYTENNPFLQPSIFLDNEITYLFKQKYSLDIDYSVAHNNFAQFVIPVKVNQSTDIKTTYLNYGSLNNLSAVLYFNQSLIKKFWDLYLTPYLNYGSYAGKVGTTDLKVTNININATIDNVFYFSKNFTGFLTFKYLGKQKDISESVLNSRSTLDLTFKKVIKRVTCMLIISDLYNGSSISKTNQFTDYLLTQNYSQINNYNRSIALQIRYSFGNNKLKGNKNRNTANQEIRNRAN